MLLALQIWCLQGKENVEENSQVQCNEWLNLLKDKQTIIATCAICICTSSMAVLESCLPLWLLAKLNPPPSRWQLGAVFIPDSIGYFIGSHFTGKSYLFVKVTV